MGISFLSDFVNGIRWDVALTLILTIILESILILKRAIKNKNLNPKTEILTWEDVILSVTTSATIYGGISAVYFAMKGKLLFNQNLIISEEYIILFAGIILISLGFLAYKKALRDIKEIKNETKK